MNVDEALALAYLKGLGYSDIVHEPDGQKTPDFLLDGHIAVEVRRLNRQVEVAPGKFVGVETAQATLLRCLRPTLRSLGPSKDGASWFVECTFSRPIPDPSLIRRELRRILCEFREGGVREREFSITDRLTFTLFPSHRPYPNCFVFAAFVDEDSAGWLIPDLLKNTQLCVAEKTPKMQAARGVYPIWWLVLIDHVAHGTWEEITVKHNWDKVILVNPLNPGESYEVRSTHPQRL